ncbi:glycosyltransferase family 4 protein [Thiocapsa rosea]|uniref:Glycosyltransferase involved in cell wall biosynthesis n=1 Tax=Thiocapsa rosea TaxID=69360 RepID=A0A495VBT4_9GAMM|nr:glycosyltransferase family 4 protein [Thiocapsa rosea]RKT46250.1 glycosyltransferase involved in cell wall biosynthesis [Thiocapsa rosea]
MSASGPLRFLIPGDPSIPTGGYRYDRRIIDGLIHAGRWVKIERLDDSFPRPTVAALVEAERCFAGLPDGTSVVVDGLAFGLLGESAARHRGRLGLIALVHHPLALETGLDPTRVEALRIGETAALASARLVVVTSDATADLLAGDYGVSRTRIRVVEPGTDVAPLAVGSGASAPNLLCVAAITPRKGHDILLQALASLTERSWRLDCVGSLTRCPATSAAVQRFSDQSGLSERVRFTGEVDESQLAALYHRADLFVLPTRFEGYGMVLTEALARGLPIVSTRTGPIPSLVPRDAGLLVEPDDPAALRAALARVLDDSGLRAGLVAGARSALPRLRSWDAASTDFMDVLDEVCNG